MRKLLLLCLASNLFAFELFINSGKEDNKDISVLHLINQSEIECEKKIGKNLKEFYFCQTHGTARLVANQDLRLFRLEFKNQDGLLNILIYPKTQSLIINSEQKLHEIETVKTNLSFKAKKLSFVFYPSQQGKLLANGLDFDVSFPSLLHPSIGGLDLEQNPINMSDNSDINAYLNIKKYYDKKQYTELLNLSEMAIKKYTSSIFMSEFELFRLRAWSKMLDENLNYSENIIKTAKGYIKKYPSSENYTEVLQLMVKTYLKLEQKSDAEYLIDILSKEHPKSYYSKLAELNYADYLLAHGKRMNATVIYNDILFGSNDATLASKAAIALAKINISHNKIDEAKEFVVKVLHANEEFLLNEKEKTISLADEFYKAKLYDISSELYEFVLNHSNRGDIYYERVLKNLGISKLKNGDYKGADEMLNRYKKEFSLLGEYSAQVNEAIDEMYFQKGEKDSFKLHENYRFLMNKYDNDIGKRALSEEVKLLYKEQNYNEILKLSEELKSDQNLDNLYRNSVYKLIESAAKNDDCEQLQELLKERGFSEFDEIIHDKEVFTCLIRKQQINKAKLAAENFINRDKIFYNLELAKLDFAAKKYAKSKKTLKWILASKRPLLKSELFDVYYHLALINLRTNEYNEAIFALKELQNYQEFKIIDVYAEFLRYFKAHKLDLSSVTYGIKAIDLQNKFGINLYSPEIEFITLEALLNRLEFSKMQEIFDDFYKLKLSDEDYSHAKYIEGQMHIKNKDFNLARKALSECKDENWKKLCEQKLELLN